MSDCLFCRIIAGEIPSARVYEDELVYAFRDIHPMAPTHVLVIPKQHIASLDEIQNVDDRVLAACLRACRTVARLEELAGGFRVVTNCGSDACQSVHHLHFHVLGGTQMAASLA